MVSKTITIKNSVGIHDKVTPFIIQKANSFSCSVWIEKDERRINAKSLLGVLSMVLTDGMEVNIIADGEKEEDAVSELCKLFAD